MVEWLESCVAATVSLTAWVVTPSLAVVFFASLGIFSYSTARRAGLLKSRCLLGDTRWVLLYLAVLWSAGLCATIATLRG